MKKIITLIAALCIMATTAQAQMSYQVSLLNTSTGEPRANVTVNATVTITNVQNEQVYTTTQSATTNDLGVLQLVVGNADTFKNLDTGKLPLFIEVSVDGVKIGKSQIMTVPVAEVATTLKSSFTKADLLGTWTDHYKTSDDFFYFYSIISFREGYAVVRNFYLRYNDNNEPIGYVLDYEKIGSYEIEGNNIYFYYDDYGNCCHLRWFNNFLYQIDGPFNGNTIYKQN